MRSHSRLRKVAGEKARLKLADPIPALNKRHIRIGETTLQTTLVEGTRLGGTCLVRGCIPSKALIHAAGQFEAMTDAVGGNRCGISLAAPPSLDFAETIRWKDGIVDRLANAAAFPIAQAA